MAAMTATGYRVVLAALVLHALVFALLAVDVAWVLTHMRGSFERPSDAWVLLALELVRALTIACAVGLGLRAGWRGAARPAARSLATLLLLGAAWYGKAFAFAPFPGPLQERMALAARGAGAPDALLALLFGDPRWVLWLVLAAFVRFAVTFPAPPDAGAVAASGARDRRGLLRGTPGAGVDVGAAFRNLAVDMHARGWLEMRPVWTAAVVLAALQLLGEGADLPLIAVFGFGAGIGFTHLRASAQRGGPAGAALRRAGHAAIVAGGLALLAGALTLRGGESPLPWLIVSLAPPILLAGLAFAVPTALGPDAGRRSATQPATPVP